MAIAWGAVSTVWTTSNFTTVAVSGSDTIGFVYVVGDTAADNITGVTWGGSAMTKIAAIQTPTDRWSSVWYIVNPSSSAAGVVTGGTFRRGYSFYYTGAKQTGQVDSSNTGTASTTTVFTLATTVVASNCWYVMVNKDTQGALTDTPSGVLVSARVTGDAGGISILDSNGTVGTGSQSGTDTKSLSCSAGMIAFSIAPASSTTIKTWDGITRANVKTLNGVTSANIKTINGIT